jgi:hypothetical protein
MIQENKCLFMHSIERKVKRDVGDGKYKFFKSINLISNDFHDLPLNEFCELTFEFLQFNIHWNLKSDFENEMFYEKCKTDLISLRNNFNHSLKKCFNDFQFLEHEKNNYKEKEKSIFDVFSDGVYLVTMFVLIAFLFPFFIFLYLNLFNEKKTPMENEEKYFPQNEPEVDLPNIHVTSLITTDKLVYFDPLSETNFNYEHVVIGSSS